MSRQVILLSNGLEEADVEFRTEEPSVEPPTLTTSKFTLRSLKFCIYAEPPSTLRKSTGMLEWKGLRMNGETDFSSYLRPKLAIIAH